MGVGTNENDGSGIRPPRRKIHRSSLKTLRIVDEPDGWMLRGVGLDQLLCAVGAAAIGNDDLVLVGGRAGDDLIERADDVLPARSGRE